LDDLFTDEFGDFSLFLGLGGFDDDGDDILGLILLLDSFYLRTNGFVFICVYIFCIKLVLGYLFEIK